MLRFLDILQRVLVFAVIACVASVFAPLAGVPASVVVWFCAAVSMSAAAVSLGLALKRC